MLTASFAIETLDSLKKIIINFTLPIVVADTLCIILHLRHNNATKTQVRKIVEGAEAFKNRSLVVQCGLNVARKMLLLFANELWSPKKKELMIVSWLI